MHATVDDVNFCDGLECVYVSTAGELPDQYMFLPVKTWLFIAWDTAFYALCNNGGLSI